MKRFLEGRKKRKEKKASEKNQVQTDGVSSTAFGSRNKTHEQNSIQYRNHPTTASESTDSKDDIVNCAVNNKSNINNNNKEIEKMRLKTNISSSSDVNDSYENVNNNSCGFSMLNNKTGFSTRTGFSTKTVKASGATRTSSGYSNHGIDEHGIDEHGLGNNTSSLSGAMAMPLPLSPSSPTSTSEIIHEEEESVSASASPHHHNISSGTRSSTATAAECSSFNSSSRNDGSTIGSAIGSTHTTATSNNLSLSAAATTTPSTSLMPKVHVAPSPSLAIPRLSKDLPNFTYNLHRSERALKSPMVGLEEKSEFGQHLTAHSRSPSHSSRGSLASPSNCSTSSNLVPSSTPAANSDFSHTSKRRNSGQSYSHSLTSHHSQHLAQNSAKSKWNVQDSNLKPIPPMHPPMPPTCTAFVDASPSMVAARIDACIKKRSLVVEYDEDAAQATVFTVERGCFVIQLYRGGKLSRAKRSILKSSKGGFVNATASANSNVHSHSRNLSNLSDIFLQESVELMSPRSTISAMSGTSGASVNANASTVSQSQGQSTTQSNISNLSQSIDPDFSHGVIVECMRVRGEVIPFHRHCRAILSAARGDSDGMDDLRSNKVALLHPPYGFGCKRSRASRKMAIGPLSMKDVHLFKQDEVPNLIQLGNSAKLRNATSSPHMNPATASTFVALENIMDLLGKDRLDANVLGIKSLVLLTDQGSSGKEASYLASLSVLDSSKDSIGHSANGRQPPRPLFRLHEKIKKFAFGRFTAPKRFVSLDDDSDDEFCIITDNVTSQDAEHIVAEYNTKLRSCAMQVLTNALNNVLYHSEEFPLLPKPSCEEFMTNEFLEKIAEDLLGATRPPMASLGSANEATFAAKFIHLIAAYSERGFFFTNGAMVGSPPRPIYGLIERAHRAGSMCHRALEIESQVALTALGGKFYAD